MRGVGISQCSAFSPVSNDTGIDPGELAINHPPFSIEQRDLLNADTRYVANVSHSGLLVHRLWAHAATQLVSLPGRLKLICTASMIWANCSTASMIWANCSRLQVE